MSDERITRDHVESRLKLVQDELQGKVNDKKAAITTGISIGAAVIILVSYLLGRRSGRKRRSTLGSLTASIAPSGAPVSCNCPLAG